MKNLNNKTVVITGAGSGIGQALAINFSYENCNLILVDINKNTLDETEKKIENAGIKISKHTIDVADREAFHIFADEVISTYGTIDIVINNAGVQIADSLENISYENLDWILGINLGGVIHGIKAFLPHMVKRKQGHIVNISSFGGYMSGSFTGPYTASKYAVRALSETLLNELRGSGVGVTSVHPGGVKTNIVKNSRLSDELSGYSTEITARAEQLFITTADTAAKRIIGAIKKDKFRLFIGIDSHIGYFCERIAPLTTMRWLNYVTRKVFNAKY